MTPSASDVNIESLLRQMGLQKIKRKDGARPGFVACCPFHQERNPSFSIGDNGLWMCWTCGVKGNLRQLQKKMGMEVGEDWKNNLRMAQFSLNGRRKEEKQLKSMMNLPAGFSLYSFEAEVPPAIARRLSWETIQSFRLGSCESEPKLRGRCVIPIHFKGKCVGYHARALKPDMMPRYYNPDGFAIKDHVFNYDGCKPGQELIVCEGAFNAMSMVEKGFTNTLATFGTQFSTPQVEKIASLRPSSVTICFDRDPSKTVSGKEVGRSGQRAAMKLGKILFDFVKVEIMPLPLEKDPNDLPAAVLAECHKRRVPLERFKR